LANSLTLSASQAILATDNLEKNSATRGQLALNGTSARQETLQSEQNQRDLRFHFCDLAAEIFYPEQVAHIHTGGLF
jgi:hypothetical protein